MGDWLVQVLDLDELKRLSERDLDILKGEVRRQLHSNPDIIEALRKVIRPKFEKLVPPEPGTGSRRQ
jgi:hypothetical protein